MIRMSPVSGSLAEFTKKRPLFACFRKIEPRLESWPPGFLSRHQMLDQNAGDIDSVEDLMKVHQLMKVGCGQ